jgi:hypothetical protein
MPQMMLEKTPRGTKEKNMEGEENSHTFVVSPNLIDSM